MNSLRTSLGVYLSLFIIVAFSSCGKWDDAYKEFLGDGEVVYSARPDSLVAKSGLHSVELEWLFTSDPNITKYKVYWNNNKDSIIKDFVRSAGVDTIRLRIKDLPEGPYNFDIYTFDAKGNPSVKSSVFGVAFGERYIGGLLPRGVASIKRIDNDMKINWAMGPEDLAFTRIVYTDINGKPQTVIASSKDSTSLLTGLPFLSSFNTQSFFLYDSLAVDTVHTPVQTVKIKPQNLPVWGNYDLIFGHNDSELMVRTFAGANIHKSYYDPESKNFSPVDFYPFGEGWNIFYTVFSLNDGHSVFALRNNGNFWQAAYYPGPAPGGAFNGYYEVAAGEMFSWKLLCSAQRKVIGRNPNTGELKYMTIKSNHVRNGVGWPAVSGPTLITGIDVTKYNAMAGLVDKWLFGRTSDGKLYRSELSFTTNTASNETLVDTGWDKYRIISSFNNNLLAAEGGYLWLIPVDANGNLGERQPTFSAEVLDLSDN